MSVKKRGTKKMNKDEVEIAKRQLNLVYGKFATNPNVTPKIPFVDKDDVILRLHRVGYIDTDFWGKSYVEEIEISYNE